jgi:hypothetical protein
MAHMGEWLPSKHEALSSKRRVFWITLFKIVAPLSYHTETLLFYFIFLHIYLSSIYLSNLLSIYLSSTHLPIHQLCSFSTKIF